MNEFELQRRLRGLDQARQPDIDLWPGIAARIDRVEATPVSRARRGWLPLAAAAALVAALFAGAVVTGLRQHDSLTHHVASTAPAALPDARTLAEAPGGDPRLLGAALELDSAHDELQQALEQRPDAVFLVSLLNRTNARRMKLDHFGASAG